MRTLKMLTLAALFFLSCGITFLGLVGLFKIIQHWPNSLNFLVRFP